MPSDPALSAVSVVLLGELQSLLHNASCKGSLILQALQLALLSDNLVSFQHEVKHLTTLLAIDSYIPFELLAVLLLTNFLWQHPCQFLQAVGFLFFNASICDFFDTLRKVQVVVRVRTTILNGRLVAEVRNDLFWLLRRAVGACLDLVYINKVCLRDISLM